jgi:hypothetical protein
MTRPLLFALLATIGFGMLCETASAQLLGRRWQRRRAELYGSLQDSLSARVDSNVAQQAGRDRRGRASG